MQQRLALKDTWYFKYRTSEHRFDRNPPILLILGEMPKRHFPSKSTHFPVFTAISLQSSLQNT